MFRRSSHRIMVRTALIPTLIGLLLSIGVTVSHAETAHDYYLMGKEAVSPGEAVSYFDQAVRMDPSFAPAYHDRGIAFQKLGEIRKAIRDFDETIRLHPDNASAYYNRGVCYTLTRVYKRAIDDYKTAIELAPEEAQAYNNLAWIYATVQDSSFRNPEQAIQYAGRAVELSRERNASFMDTLAESYYAAGRYAEAVEWGEKALSLEPDSETLKNHLKRFRNALKPRAD